MSVAFRAAHAAGDPWSVLVKSCLAQLTPLPEGANLGFLYATDALSGDLESILTFLRERTRIADWVGSVGLGVCASGIETVDAPGLAVMIAALPQGSFRVFAPIADDLAHFTAETAPWLAQHEAGLGKGHGVGRRPTLA